MVFKPYHIAIPASVGHAFADYVLVRFGYLHMRLYFPNMHLFEYNIWGLCKYAHLPLFFQIRRSYSDHLKGQKFQNVEKCVR